MRKAAQVELWPKTNQVLFAPCATCGGKASLRGDDRVRRRLLLAPEYPGWYVLECGHSYVRVDDPALENKLRG